MLAKARKSDAPYTNLRQQIHPRFLEQAVVATKNLTGNNEWNVFLQRIQAMCDQERALLNTMADAISGPNLTNEQISQGQRHMVAAKARIDAWEQVINLPKEILSATQPDSE